MTELCRALCLVVLVCACGSAPPAPQLRREGTSGGELPLELATSAELLQTVMLCKHVALLDGVYPPSEASSADTWPHLASGTERTEPQAPAGLDELLRFCRQGAALGSFVAHPEGRTQRYRAWERFVVQSLHWHDHVQSRSTTSNGTACAATATCVVFSDRSRWDPPAPDARPSALLDASDVATLSAGSGELAQRSAMFGGLDATVLMSGLARVVEERAHQEIQLYVARNLHTLLGCEALTEEQQCPESVEQLHPAYFLRGACAVLGSWRDHVSETGGSLSWQVLAEALHADLDALPENLACLAPSDGQSAARDTLLGWIRFVLYVVGAVRESLDPAQMADALAERVARDPALPRPARAAAMLFSALTRLPAIADLPTAAIVGLFRTLTLDMVDAHLADAVYRRVGLDALDEDLQALAALPPPPSAPHARVILESRVRERLGGLGLCASEVVARVDLPALLAVEQPALGNTAYPCGGYPLDRLLALRELVRGARARLREIVIANAASAEALVELLTSGRERSSLEWSELAAQARWLLLLLQNNRDARVLSALLELLSRPRDRTLRSPLQEVLQAASCERQLCTGGRTTMPQLELRLQDAAGEAAAVAELAARILPELLSDAVCDGDRACAERLSRASTAARDAIAALAQAKSVGESLGEEGLTDAERASRVATLANAIVRAVLGVVRLVGGGDARFDPPPSLELLIQAIVERDGAAILSRSLRVLSELGARLRAVPAFHAGATVVPDRARQDAWRQGLEQRVGACFAQITSAGSRDFRVTHPAAADQGSGVRSEVLAEARGPYFPYGCVRAALESSDAPLPGGAAVATVRVSFDRVVSLEIVELDEPPGVLAVFGWDDASERRVEDCFSSAGAPAESRVILVSVEGTRLVADTRDVVPPEVARCVDEVLGRASAPADPSAGSLALRVSVDATRDEGLLGRLPAQVSRALAFGAELIEAQDAAEVERAVNAFAAPVGSYASKRHRFGFSITGTLALQAGGEVYLDRSRPSLPSSAGQLGGHLSLGLDLTWPLGSAGSFGFYVPILNLTPFASFSLQSEQPAPSLEGVSLLSPGLFVRWGILDTPLILGAGVSYTPDLRAHEIVGTDGVLRTERLGALQIGLLLGVDVTLFGF